MGLGTRGVSRGFKKKKPYIFLHCLNFFTVRKNVLLVKY